MRRRGQNASRTHDRADCVRKRLTAQFRVAAHHGEGKGALARAERQRCRAGDEAGGVDFDTVIAGVGVASGAGDGGSGEPSGSVGQREGLKYPTGGAVRL